MNKWKLFSCIVPDIEQFEVIVYLKVCYDIRYIFLTFCPILEN